MPQGRDNPSPRQSQPAPRSQPTPRSFPGTSSPGYNPPARSNPAPRTTTRGDTQPPPVSTPRYQPPSDDGGRTGRTISRPNVASPAPVRPAPSVGENADRGGRGAVDSRYRPAPRIDRPAPTDGNARPGTVARPGDGARPSDTTRPVDGGRLNTGGRLGDNGRTGESARPADGARPVDGGRTGLAPRQPGRVAPNVSTRYTPRDVAPAATRPGTTRPATPTQNLNSGVVARPRLPNASIGSPVVSPVTPRLSTPRSGITSGILAPRSSNWSYGSGGNHWNHNHWQSCHRSIWYGYWDPCHSYSSWNNCHDWSIGFCGSSFGWRLSLWYPFWYSRTHYWGHCYGDSFWCSWTRPHCVSSSYWWYPTTTYCPTYLYVPSTVYVTEAAAPEAPAAAPAPEIVVAGGGVVGSARAVDVAPAGAEDLSASLAVKYVELGDFYFKANRFRDAAEAYGKARSYAPNDASVHFVLADAVFADGDYHYAAFLIAEGLRLDPAMASAETDKRTFYSDVKVFEAQVAALDNYLEKAPYDAQAHFVRGYNLRFSGQSTRALAAFRRVLEIQPDHRAAQVFGAALEAKAAGDVTVR